MNKLKSHIDDIVIGGGLIMLGVGIWGLSGNVYLSLATIGTIILIIGVKAITNKG